jgi:hypothetical protein
LHVFEITSFGVPQSEFQQPANEVAGDRRPKAGENRQAQLA